MTIMGISGKEKVGLRTLIISAAVGMIWVAGCTCSETIEWDSPEELATALEDSVRKGELYRVVDYLHPRLRAETRLLIDACMDNLEARDVLVGYLSRRADWEPALLEYPSMQRFVYPLSQESTPQRDKAEPLVQRVSATVVYIHLNTDRLAPFPARAERHGDTWVLRDAPSDENMYMKERRMSRILLGLQSAYFQKLSQSLRLGELDAQELRSELEKEWY